MSKPIGIEKIGKIIEKLYHKKMVNYILGKRICSKCAGKLWKKEDKSQSFTMLMGICENCKKGGLVAYIEK